MHNYRSPDNELNLATIEMSIRHNYLGREYCSCSECGDVFIRKMSSLAVLCSKCKHEICYKPWDHAYQHYRALRSDEDVGSNGLRCKDPDVDSPVGFHVQHGSDKDTQYISTTSSIAVAAFFAVKGFQERNNEIPRIACFDAPYDIDRCYALDLIPNRSDMVTARNFAGRFQEYVFTEEDARRSLTLNKIIRLDLGLLGEFEGETNSFTAFKEQYTGSDLENWIQSRLDHTLAIVTLDLVGLHDYGTPPGQVLQEIQMVLEGDNEYDNKAIRVDGRFDNVWKTIGHLSREHARVCRAYLEASDNLYRRLELPDLQPFYETRLRLGFEIPENSKMNLIHHTLDTCGKVYFVDQWDEV